MSFVLPGNARQLRFTGEAKALSSDAPESKPPASMRTGMSALGKPRIRKASPSISPMPISTPYPASSQPHPISTPPPSRVAVGVHATITTPSPGSGFPAPPPSSLRPPPPSMRPPPSLGHRVSTPIPSYGANNPVVRHKSDSDDIATMAMDRDAMDVMPGGNLMRPPAMGMGNAPQRAPNAAPIPHFRSHPLPAPPPVPVIPNTGSHRMRAIGAPYAVWVFASILAGILSYHVAPEILARFEAPKTAQNATP